MPHLTKPLPQLEIDVRKSRIPKRTELADPGYASPDRCLHYYLEPLIFWEIIEREKQYLGKDRPVIKRIKLGWIVVGDIQMQLLV